MPAMTLSEFGLVLLAMSERARQGAYHSERFPGGESASAVLHQLANTFMAGAEKCVQIGDEKAKSQ